MSALGYIFSFSALGHVGSWTYRLFETTPMKYILNVKDQIRTSKTKLIDGNTETERPPQKFILKTLKVLLAVYCNLFIFKSTQLLLVITLTNEIVSKNLAGCRIK